jgi:FAD/FMN-containing dehydrogenase
MRPDGSTWNNVMSSGPQLNPQDTDELEAAVDQAIAACGGDMRSTIRALIVANEFLESEVGELMKAVSHAYVRGRFQTYSG